MSERLDYPLLLTVDSCVEQLLAGRDWRSQLPSDESRLEVTALLEVAERLLDGSERDETNATRAPGVRLRVWQKLTRAVQRLSIRPVPKPEVSPWALRIGATPVAFPLPASGGVYAAVV